MRVLSIDWDYFQNVTKETVQKYYPDGIDLPTNLSEIVWGSKYTMYASELSEVTLLCDEYNSLLALLSKQNRNCPVMIANSHSHIYGFIHSYLRGKIQITNIDMHHDIINDNAELDCGNWISNLIKDNVIAKSSPKEYKSIRWITNPISLDTYGLSDELDPQMQKTLTNLCQCKSVSDICNEKFDIIYLARSDNWSPPHLDTYFCDLVKKIKERFFDIVVERGIDKPRKEYLAVVESVKNYV